MILSGTSPQDISFDDEDLLIGYRREHIVKVYEESNHDFDDDIELSEDIQYRLFLARTMAMLKYKEKWG